MTNKKQKFLSQVSEKAKELGGRIEELKRSIATKSSEDDVRSKPVNEQVYRDLPPPKLMTMPLTDALNARQSHRTFSDEPLTDLDLGTILWAADGLNRPDGRKTTPSALNWQEVSIYCLKANGTWVYEPAKHALRFISLEDIRHASIIAQPMIKVAPVQLVLVADKRKTDGLWTKVGRKVVESFKPGSWTPERLEETLTRSMTIDAAVKIQSIYLAAAALNIGCVARTGFDQALLKRVMPLDENQVPIACVTLGYKAKTIVDTIS